MNNIQNRVSNNNSSPEASHKDAVTSTESPTNDDEPTGPTNSTSRKRHGQLSSRLSMRNFFNAFKSYILSSEDDTGIQYASNKDFDYIGSDREPMFVIVDSSCVSNPSSKEILIDSRFNSRDTVLKKHYNKNVMPVDLPSTSRDLRTELLPPQLKESESTDEMQMMDINLQSDNELSLGDSEGDNDSIVISYLKNKDAFLEMEGTLMSTKKKSSLLESIPKMETILESEQFSAIPMSSKNELPSDNFLNNAVSESSLDVHIPSFPGSPRSYMGRSSIATLFSNEDMNSKYKRAIEFLHHDNEFLTAAEYGDEKLLKILIDQGTNIHAIDHLGRTALHFAVCSGNRHAVSLLLFAGVKPNVKDNVGMTPLSLCLMRRPSWRMANMLFDHGTVLLSRGTPMDTGLFLQFVMMCTPTKEEERILRLLVEKGADVNDPEAPGGRKALHFAAMSNNTRLINILFDLGANLFVVNHRNETPREVAATFKCKEAFALLEQLEEVFEYSETTTATSSEMEDTSNE